MEKNKERFLNINDLNNNLDSFGEIYKKYNILLIGSIFPNRIYCMIWKLMNFKNYHIKISMSWFDGWENRKDN